jgi:hypothetical protein
MTRLSYDAILERLEAIENDLATRQAGFERAARDVHKLERDYKLREARTALVTKGATMTEKKWRTIDAIAASGDGLYEALTLAEGDYEGYKAAIDVLKTRASIGQSLLRQASQERGG